VAILPPRWKPDIVAGIGMALFAAERFEPGEMRTKMLIGKKAPGEPIWTRLELEVRGERRSAPWKCRFTIGGDVFIYGRIVENLKEPAFGTITWDEIRLPRRLG
jgi:hypothetical protein